MNHRWTIAAALLAAAGVCRAAPLATYGRLPFIEQMAISPDGKAMAFVATDGERRKIVVEDLATAKFTFGLNGGEQKIRDLRWAGPNHLIVTASVTSYVRDVESPRGEWWLSSDVNLTTKKQRNLMAGAKDALNVDDDLPEVRIVKGRPYAFVHGIVFVNNEGQLALFKIDLDADDQVTMLTAGLKKTSSYSIDAKGAPLAESDYDADKSHWVMRIWKGGGWHEVRREEAPIETPELEGLGRDGASVLVSFDEGHRRVLRELGPTGGTWSDALPFSDWDALIRDPVSHALIGRYALDRDVGTYEFLEPDLAQRWKAIVAGYPGETVTLVSHSDDWNKFLLHLDSSTEGPSYALFDIKTGQGQGLAADYNDLKPEDISPVRPIAYKAKDGLPLTGYLTVPYGKEAKNLPLVVFPHGGPASRDEPGFDWWPQAMASRGYAVLQVNYRGSDGFGWDFLSAGFGQWGRKMQTDLSDGVRYLASQGIIDPKRVCIVGASYGGYAALAGATLDPGVYRCAASVAGVADVAKLIAWDKAQEGSEGVATERYWTRYMGAATDLDTISPALQADKVAVPILLVHGKDDTVVPYAQSQMMADALTRAGKSVELVTLKSEDHWLSRGATRLQMLTAVVAFLEKNNPP